MSNIEVINTELVSRAQRLERILTDPHLIDIICNNVTNGGSVITLAEGWEVGYADITNWLNADQGRLQKYLNALNARDEWAKEKLLHELRLITDSDLRLAFDDSGKIKDPKDWPDKLAKCISSFDVQEHYSKDGDHLGTTYRIKLWDKLKASEMLGRNMKLFIDRIEHTGTVTLEDLIMGTPHGKLG